MAKEFDSKFISDLSDAVIGHTNDCEIAALSSLQGEFLQRIHNDRKATDGTSLGRYKDQTYKKKRAKRGRQVTEKDLEDTGALRRSVKVGTSNGKNVMGFNNDLSRLIAEGQIRDNQVGKPTHNVSDAELENSLKDYVIELDIQLNRI